MSLPPSPELTVLGLAALLQAVQIGLAGWAVNRDAGPAWNAGPRDETDALGPYEASLIGNPVADPEKPLEVIRTVHSFDPCLACAIHMLDTDRRQLVRVKAL